MLAYLHKLSSFLWVTERFVDEQALLISMIAESVRTTAIFRPTEIREIETWMSLSLLYNQKYV